MPTSSAQEPLVDSGVPGPSGLRLPRTPGTGGLRLPLTPGTGGPRLPRTPDAGGLQLPDYPRGSLVPSVVHIGLGGFHRSHQAVYFDALARTVGSRWGIVGASMRSRHVVDALACQHGLYTMLERGNRGETARIIGSVVDCLFGPDDPARLVAVLSDPRVRLVTLTITGDGYVTSPGPPQESNPWGVWDYLVEALARRRRSAILPFTVLSCDNIPANGHAAKAALLATARNRDEVLARWVDHRVACPESMVDRITSPASVGQYEHVEGAYGVSDHCSVVAEPFSQWIVGEEFCNERPTLEAVGVQFVHDVTPYSLMKRRLLNGGHSALGFLGVLAGYRWTDEAVANPAMRGYLAALMREEISPLLPHVSGIDLLDYQQRLMERFSNGAIRDPLQRLCSRGSTKMVDYLLPSAWEASAAGRPRELLAAAVAGWMRYLRGTDLTGASLVVEDARKDELQPLAVMSQSDPRPLLAKRDVFGDLIEDEVFVVAVERSLTALEHGGVDALLARCRLVRSSEGA